MQVTSISTFPVSLNRGPWQGLEGLDVVRLESSELRIAFVSSTRAGLDPLDGMAHAFGVAERLGADLIVQLGDAIPGYAEGAALDAQWDALDEILGAVRTPLIRVAGNHDISDAAGRSVWTNRVGAAAYAVRAGSVLFLVLDAQDGEELDADEFLAAAFDQLDPTVHARITPWMRSGVDGERIRALLRDAPEDGAELLRAFSAAKAARGGDAVIGDAQVEWARGVLDLHGDAAWTFVLMHQPGWVGAGAPGLARVLEHLGDRPASVLSGHVIHAGTVRRDGRVLASLGYTDPARSDTRFGRGIRRDLLTWVRMSADGPVFTNIPLDDVLDLDQRRLFTPAEWA